MEWNNFDDGFNKLRTVLRDISTNQASLDIYGSYLDYCDDVKVIVQRIEAETQDNVESTRRLFEMLKKGEDSDDEFLKSNIETLIQIRLDIKSFFIFTRIFLDTLARIVRLYFDKKGHQLDWGMSELLKNETLMKLDADFAIGLKERMSWIDSFVEHRVEIEHYLGGIRSTITKDGKFGFDIECGKRPTSRIWGTETVKSITDYMQETLSNLSEVCRYLYDKFHNKLHPQ